MEVIVSVPASHDARGGPGTLSRGERVRYSRRTFHASQTNGAHSRSVANISTKNKGGLGECLGEAPSSVIILELLIGMSTGCSEILRHSPGS